MPRVYPARFPSVADIRAGRGPRFSEPKAGTKLRDLYDLFVEHPGEAVEVNIGYDSALEPLRNYWGLDIRRIYRGAGGKFSCYVLAAYWDGTRYVECPLQDSLLRRVIAPKKHVVRI